MIKGLQGDKSIGRKWYLLIKKLLESFGFVACPVEPTLYLFRCNDKMMIVNTSTDDFLCAHSHTKTYASLVSHLKKYFDVTTKQGTKFKYLNLRIIQSEHCISFDQTKHIKNTIVNRFFPPATTEHMRSTEYTHTISDQ